MSQFADTQEATVMVARDGIGALAVLKCLCQANALSRGPDQLRDAWYHLSLKIGDGLFPKEVDSEVRKLAAEYPRLYAAEKQEMLTDIERNVMTLTAIKFKDAMSIHLNVADYHCFITAISFLEHSRYAGPQAREWATGFLGFLTKQIHHPPTPNTMTCPSCGSARR